MGATVGANVGLANFIGYQIIRKVADNKESRNVCKLTDELLNDFEEYNKNRIVNGYGDEKMVLVSMDVEKWYNNLLAEPGAKIFKEMVVKSLSLKVLTMMKQASIYLNK